MSIYIKGMKIPKVGVYTCELSVLDENTAVLTIYTPIDEQQRSYKLTPLPEGHGRLGDLDKLADDMKARKAFFGRMSDPQCIVEDAPTIVSADTKERMKTV